MVADMKAAVAYLKSRPDADPRGFGFFGVSKGAQMTNKGTDNQFGHKIYVHLYLLIE